MYLSRQLEGFIRTASKQFPAILLTGARQVGKTTLLRHLADEGRTYVNLDDPLVLELARQDPGLFLQRFDPPVLIDEIQYAPNLLPLIKMAIDSAQTPGMFWLTGSQQFHLMQGVSESLAGRVGVIQLLGLSRHELLERPEKREPFLPGATPGPGQIAPLPLRELYQYIWRGSYPGLVISEAKDKNLFYGSYVQTYLQRDVRELARVGDEMAFLRFLRVAAARTAQLVNLSEMARDADVSPNTAKSWLSILQTSGIVYLLEPYHTNVTKRLVKSPKLYFLDTGLAAYLTEWTTSETLEAGAMSGAILETWILVELLKSYWHNGQRAPFYFYRDKDGKEIDLLIVRDGRIHPVEFKKTASPGQKDIRHFNVLKRLGPPVEQGGIICLVDQSLPLGADVHTIPVASL